MEGNTHSNPTDINLTSTIAELKFLFSIVRKHILLFAIIGILGGASGVLMAYFSKSIYKADLKFVMKSDANSGLSSSLSNLNSLLGSGSGSTGSPLERIIELIGSDLIIGNALLEVIEVDGKKDLVINHFIQIENLRSKWTKDTLLSNVTFTTSDKYDHLTLGQRKAMRKVSSAIIGKDFANGVISKSFDRKSGVVVLSVKHFNESFAIELTKCIYNQIIGFYIDQSVSTTKHNVEILSNKADSIRRELDATRYAYAGNTDQALGLLLQKDRVPNKSLAIKEAMLTAMYAEVQKNLETLRFIEASTVPSFAIIDAPYSPIEPVKKSKSIFGLIGLMIPCSLLLGYYRFKYKTNKPG